VAIDITKDKLISLKDAAKLFPKAGGGHIHSKTVKNWITHGYQGIKLEGAQVGSKFYTTTDALRRFSEQLNERRQPEAPGIGQPGSPVAANNPAAAATPAEDDFTIAGDDFSASGDETLTGSGGLTVEIPCQPATRNSG
jgi:hypothetical protein